MIGLAAVDAGIQSVPVPRPLPSTVCSGMNPVDLRPCLQQAVREDDRIVDLVADQPAGRDWPVRCMLASDRRLLQARKVSGWKGPSKPSMMRSYSMPI
jgi:hypothetical protein